MRIRLNLILSVTVAVLTAVAAGLAVSPVI